MTNNKAITPFRNTIRSVIKLIRIYKKLRAQKNTSDDLDNSPNSNVRSYGGSSLSKPSTPVASPMVVDQVAPSIGSRQELPNQTAAANGIRLSAMNIKHFSKDHTPDYRRNEQQEMLIAPPLDLSFKKAANMDELMEKRPQTVRTGKAPARTFEDRYLTSTLWLSNNLLSSMEGFERLANRLLDKPAYLSWLDLSFNEIREIAEEINKFTNVKILYLHGNKISNITDILRLRKLKNLRSLTLHGNPIEDIPCYRNYIVHLLPQLVVLDFSPVIAGEKQKALPVGFFKIMQPEIQT